MPDGSYRIVPQPSARHGLIQQQHVQSGHFGIRRTTALLAPKYWWHGMQADVTHVLNRCEHCSRVRASFSAKQDDLQPIPISSMGFRWHVDLAGPFPISARGNKYVMVAIEAFSKHLVAVPIVSKEAAVVAYAFLHNVLARFAAPGQVVSDNGSEFTEGAFSQLLLDSMIDHCTTSVSHPRANGQAEKAVHIVKAALRKMCLQQHDTANWDRDVAHLMLGYNCSPHSSTGFSPYQLMFARQPIVPPAVRDSMSQPLKTDDQAAAADDLCMRKQLVQRLMPEALENLKIAQHRDLQRYAAVRSADYKPRLHRFQPGDYVYVQQLQQHSTLQPKARPSILKVLQVRPTGVLQLQGKCGRTALIRQEQCAPCHLPDLDGTIDPVLNTSWSSMTCEVCATERPQSKLLLCDYCNKAYHIHCLQPPLDAVPSGYWLCADCAEQGVTAADAAAREQQRQPILEQQNLPNLYPDAAMRRRDEAAAALHGRLVRREFHNPVTKQLQQYWGRVHFLGADQRPRYFYVVYQDGDGHGATKAMVDKILMPADQQPPSGITVPFYSSQQLEALEAAATASAAVAAMSLAASSQQTASPSVIATPTAADVQQLLQSLDLSRVVYCSHPGRMNMPLQQLLQQHGVLLLSPEQATASAVVLLAAQPAVLLQALAAAAALKPAFMACYVPGLQTTTQLSAILQQHGQHAVGLRVGGGIWVCISCIPLPVSAWLR